MEVSNSTKKAKIKFHENVVLYGSYTQPINSLYIYINNYSAYTQYYVYKIACINSSLYTLCVSKHITYSCGSILEVTLCILESWERESLGKYC